MFDKMLRSMGIIPSEYLQMLEQEKKDKENRRVPVPPKAVERTPPVEVVPQSGILTPQELVELLVARAAAVPPAPAKAFDAAAEAARRQAQTALCYVFEEHLMAGLPELMVQAGRKDVGYPGCWVVIGKITEQPEVLTALQEVGVVPGRFDQLQPIFLLRLEKALAEKSWRLREHTLDLEVDLAIQLVLEPFPLDALQDLPTPAA